MSKHIQKKFQEVKNDIKTMGESIDKINLNNSIPCIDFSRITTAKPIYKKVIPLINKYNGVIYGTSIGASIKNPKIAVRKTDDIDVRFSTEKDRTAFVKDVIKAIGNKYYIKNGYFGAIIKRKSDDETIIDTHVMEKGWSKKQKGKYKVTNKDSFVTLKTNNKKIKEYCNTKGETYSVSAQAKLSAVLTDLNVGYSKDPLAKDKIKRIGKDALDVRLYNADTLIKAYEMWKKENNPQKKEELRKLINQLGRAILRFSARKDIIKYRQIAERDYIRKGMLNKRTFTDEERMRKEHDLYLKVKRNPKLDLTKVGVDWLEAMPINKKKYYEFEQINASNMF